MTFTNRYKSDCFYCGKFVAAGEGVYDYGKVSCTDYIYIQTGVACEYHCLVTFNQKFNTSFSTPEEAQQFQHEQVELEKQQYRVEALARMIDSELQELAVKANVRSLQQVINKVTGATIIIDELTWEQAVSIRSELLKRIDRKNAAANREVFKKSNTCSRCGGAGGADKWKMTGTICWKCGGSGKYYN